MTEAAIAIRALGKKYFAQQRIKRGGVDAGAIGTILSLATAAFDPRRVRKQKRYFEALKELDLEIVRGEVVGVIGRNGAGKSTLLKILARVVEPTSGQVELRGRVASLLELGIGFSPDLTVRENIELYSRITGLSHREVQEIEPRVLAMADLADKGDVPLGLCPGGSFVRLAFATIMSIEADIILADEVLAVGDAKFRGMAEAEIAKAPITGRTVLFVSHDLAAIRRCCSRVVWIDLGRIKAVGNTDAITREYEKTFGTVEREASAASDREGNQWVLDLRLVDGDGFPIGATRLDKPSQIECLAKGPAGRGARTVLHFFVAGRPAFKVVSPPLQTTETTEVRTKLYLPPDFLNETTYRVVGFLALDDGTDRLANVTPAAEIAFSAINTNAEKSVWSGWPSARPGQIAPRLDWSLERDRT